VIEFRKKFIQDSERSCCLPLSVFDLSWFSKIKFNSEDGILFIATDVFYYFKENEVKSLFCAMAEHFPNGKLVFDAESKSMVKASNRSVRKSGNKGAQMYFYVNKPDKIKKWSNKIEVDDVLPVFYTIPRDKKWKFSTRIFMMICDITKMMKCVVLQFK
jgi:O-methyltransferase involved in polyketide biosynthesis